MPPYLASEKYSADFEYFNTLRNILGLLEQLREFLWNLVIQAADVTYTDSFEYYATIREVAVRGIDGAESIFNDLKPFFESRGSSSETGEKEPTEMELKRDINAFLHGKHDGEVIIRNEKLKIQAGKREVIDKKFTDSEQFKETKEADFNE
jgi:hypothetical protein